MVYLTKEQFRVALDDPYDERLIDTDDHGWSSYEFVVYIDQYMIDNLGFDPALLDTYWALDVVIQPEWGIQWAMCYDEPQQVERKEVVTYEWKAVK